jgi:hypothetical protein
MKKATHSYVASLPCGCGVAICLDTVDYPRDTAESVATMISDGYQVQRYEHEQALAAFLKRCDKYPHEDWQKRNEAARAKRQSQLPLAVIPPSLGAQEAP